MTDQLHRVRVRLRQADELLWLFDSSSGADPTGVPLHGVGQEVNDDGPTQAFVLAEEGLVDTLNVLVSDCLHNLRSTLDTLIYRLAELQTGGPLHPEAARTIAFPICPTPIAFRNAVRQGRMTGLSEAAYRLVRDFQPYNRTSTPFGDSLLLLDHLQSVDKHRMLVRLRLDNTEDTASVTFDECVGLDIEPSRALHQIRTEVGEIIYEAEQLPECG